MEPEQAAGDNVGRPGAGALWACQRRPAAPSIADRRSPSLTGNGLAPGSDAASCRSSPEAR